MDEHTFVEQTPLRGARSGDEQLCLARLLAEQAERRPDAIAIAAPGRVGLSYARLQAHVHETARTLRAMGIRREDRVAVVLPNGPEMAAAFLAVAAAATCAPLNPAYRAAEFEFYLTDLGARLLLVPAGSDSPAIAVARRLGMVVVELTPSLGAEAGLFTLGGAGDGARQGAGVAPDLASSEDVALVLHTSGTTSRPKIVPLTQRNLYLSAHSIRASLELSPEDRCLNIMPLFHIHGLVGAVLSSLAAGAMVSCTPGFDAPRFFDWVAEVGPTWYTAVPTMHQAILARAARDESVAASCPLRFIRSCSASLPPQVMADLEQTFGVPVVEAYGMTEASHQMTCNPLPPRARKPGSVGIATGVAVGIMDEAGNLLSPGSTGEVVIRGESVTQGYENNPAANATAYTQGWFRTGDQGHLDDEGYLFLSGRIKEIINRAGEKISPREVDEALLAHPAVAQAVSFAMPDPRLGEDVAAAVVLRPDAAATERELQQFAAGRLADFKVPRRVLFLSEIPKGPTGKVQRIGLAERLAPPVGRGKGGECPAEEAGAEFVAPRDATEEAVAAIWAEVLGQSRVGVHDEFLDLGGDSLLATRILARVHGAFGVTLSFQVFFEASTVAQMAAAIMEAIADSGPRVPEAQAPDERQTVLSYAQERLWFLEQLNPGSPAYTVSKAFRLAGPLDFDALRRSLNAIVQRHELLRARFRTRDGRPDVEILPELAVDLPVVDLRDMPVLRREAEADRLARDDAYRPFDLQGDALLRASLILLEEHEQVLLISFHHIVSDAWSMGVFLRELGVLYHAFAAGQASPLPDLPIRYADHAARQRQRLQGDAVAGHLSYWREQLGGELPVLEMPTDRPYPAIPSYRGGSESLLIPPSLVGSLEALSRQERCTPFVTLVAAFQALLSRLTGQDEIIVGTPIAGRMDEDTEGLIGLFVNTLVLRTDLSGNPTFRELMGRVRSVALGAYTHGELPFERLVEELSPERSTSRNPLFEVMVNYRPPAAELQLSGVTVAPVGDVKRPASLPMTLYAAEQGGALRLEIAYQRDLFEPARIAALLQQLDCLLQQIAAEPDAPIRSHSLAAPHALRVLPDAAEPLPAPDYPPVTESLRAWAAQTPEAPAIVQGSRVWTYRALVDSAETVARVLLSRGVRPGDVVAVTGPRSFGLLSAILGTAFSRGVFLTIDPALPAERRRLMLREAGARVLLQVGAEGRTTDYGLRTTDYSPGQVSVVSSQLSSALGVTTVGMDCEAGVPAGAEASAVDLPAILPEDAAYIFFTSGTTGKPKGVLGWHKGLAHFVQWQRETFSIGPGDRCALLTNLSFDVVLRDIFTPLTSGATLCIPEGEEEMEPERVLRWLDRDEITILHTVPTRAQAWLACVPDGVALRHLRWVFLAGEPLPHTLVQRWREAFPDSGQAVNLYGPTESTMVKSYHVLPGELSPGIQPVGRSLPHTQLLVLGENDRLCGIGEIGEIAIRTPYLTRGYINAPEEQVTRFVPNPFRADPDDLLYRTGDRGRYRPDGVLEILGRLDDQVKIRGVRVEPGEVSALLLQHPGVKACAVIARKDAAGDDALAAYVVPVEPQTASIPELQAHLAHHLPAPMVPGGFVLLDRLPLTGNGKLDRRALPAPPAPGNATDDWIEPRTPVESALAEIWAEVLGLERVPVNVSFFGLGGHSLSATRVVARTSSVFQIHLPLRSLFKAPTIAAFAEEIACCMAAEDEEDAAGSLAEMDPAPISAA